MALLSVILPIVLLIAAGYLLARLIPIEVQSLSRVSMYLLTPSLVFAALVRADVSAAAAARLIGLIVVQFGVLLVIVLLAGRLMGLAPLRRSGLAVSTVLYNAGNYGIPVGLFAFGEEGVRLATLIFVVSAILMHSVGVFLASAGRNRPAQAALDIFRLPLIYAAIAGVVFAWRGWVMPVALWRPIDLMAQGAIPVLLITLGVQLSQARPSVVNAPLGASAALRLVVSPLLTVALAPWFGIAGLPRDVAVMSTAMPTAINAFLIAAQFDAAPDFVASAVFLTTVASFVSVPIVLALLP